MIFVPHQGLLLELPLMQQIQMAIVIDTNKQVDGPPTAVLQRLDLMKCLADNCCNLIKNRKLCNLEYPHSQTRPHVRRYFVWDFCYFLDDSFTQ